MEDMGMTDLQFKSWLRQIIRRLEEAEGEENKEKTDQKAGGIIERPETRFARLINSDTGNSREGGPAAALRKMMISYMVWTTMIMFILLRGKCA